MKCFNCIRQEAGRRALLALGLPKEHVHQWYHSIQKLQRYWEIDSSSHGPVLATCGFPEGDSHSVLAMLAIALTWNASLQALLLPTLQSTSYADNWSWSTTHPQHHGAIATRTLEFTALCGLSIDWKKTWLWATENAVAAEAQDVLHEALPNEAIQRLHHARDLGFELQYSGPHRLGHRKARIDKGIQRLEKTTDHDI